LKPELPNEAKIIASQIAVGNSAHPIDEDYIPYRRKFSPFIKELLNILLSGPVGPFPSYLFTCTQIKIV
jgi:hypothetical protein